MRPGITFFAALSSGAFASTPASGQVKWDVGGEAGVVKRFTTAGSAGASSPGLGPSFEAQGHVAVVPMVRMGLYVGMSLLPRAGTGTDKIGERTYWEGGAQVRVTPPLLPAPWRAWAFAGVGYVYTYAESYDFGAGQSSTQHNAIAQGVGGGFVDVPLGIGLGYRLNGPWVLFVEGGGEVGVGFSGPVYAGSPPVSGASTSSRPGTQAAFGGHDSFALSLSVGLSFDR
jgi:hypothetical protein